MKDLCMCGNSIVRYRDYFQDLYISIDKLKAFLRSLDPNKPYMLGQAGLGNTEGESAYLS